MGHFGPHAEGLLVLSIYVYGQIFLGEEESRLKYTKLFSLTLVVALFATTTLRAEVSDAEFQAMKAEMHAMRSTMAGMKGADAPLESVVDKAGCAACNAPVANNVTTAAGKLVMGGLVQVWYQNVAKDTQGLFNDPAGNGVFDSNAAYNKSGFSIHTVELYFDMAITNQVSAFVYLNPAAEIASNTRPVIQRRLANVSPEYNNANGPFAGATTGAIAALQNGAGAVPNLLQDAIINFHDFFPHHDITVGQMLNTFNEENFAADNALDFVDRSYIGNQVSRDTGAVLHGSWWNNKGGGSYCGAGDEGRFQYWLGVWNGAGNLYGGAINRQDDNNAKDFVGTLLLRPLWNDCAGQMEVGYSFRTGTHGGGSGQVAAPINAMERNSTRSLGHDVWFKYMAPGCFKGLWLKAEGTWMKDRSSPGSVIDQAAVDFQGAGGGGAAFSTFGYWASIGYKFGDSPHIGDCHKWLKNFEVAFRYESAPNVLVTDPQDTGRGDGYSRTNVYSSKVYTAGVNYYIAGNNAKIQLNYNHIDNPEGPSSNRFHALRSDSMVLNFQVSW